MQITSRKMVRLGTVALAAVVLISMSTIAASALTPARLAFGAQPTTTVAGRVIPTVTVRVLDGQGQLVTDSTVPVTLRIGTHAATATLYGTTKVNAVGGIATFNDLRIIPGDTGYTLVATSSPTLTGDTSSPFDITGAAVVCGASGCSVGDPNGITPSTTNSTTGTITIPNCPGATGANDFLSYDESAGNFCAGGCLGAAVFFDSECNSGDPWLIIYRLDKSLLRTDKGAPHVNIYIDNGDGTGTLVPQCVKQGVLDPAPTCVSRQYKNGQGDSITEILKAAGDPRYAG